MPSGTPHPQHLREEFLKRFDEVPNSRRIAAQLGISPETARKWVHQAGLAHRLTPARPKHQGRDEYYRLRAAGMSQAHAAAHVGASTRSARRWDLQGQISYNMRMKSHTATTDPLVAKTHLRYLSLQERLIIADQLRTGVSAARIAAALGRSRSTITREITRNSDAEGMYWPHQAHARTQARKPRPKALKLAAGTRLFTYVQAKLGLEWSPEQISAKLKEDFPGDQEMRVCHETIYQALYLQARGGLKREVQAALRTGRVVRKPSGAQRRPRTLGAIRG